MAETGICRDETVTLDTCPLCGAALKEGNCSLHVWQLTYCCGCRIYGAHGETTYDIEVRCDSQPGTNL